MLNEEISCDSPTFLSLPHRRNKVPLQPKLESSLWDPLGRGWGPSLPPSHTEHPSGSVLTPVNHPCGREEHGVEGRGGTREAPEERRALGRGGRAPVPLPPSALPLMPSHYLVCQWQTIKLKVSITSALSLRFSSLLSIHHSPALLQPIAANLHQLLIY